MRLAFDLAAGIWRIIDTRTGAAAVSGAAVRINEWSSRGAGLKRTWTERVVSDELGRGRALDIRIAGDGRPDLLFTAALYEDAGFLALSGGVVNTTGGSIRVKDLRVCADGRVYRGVDFAENFAMVDGFSGGEPLEYGTRIYSPLHRGNALRSRNNIALTFGAGATRRTLVMGGLTYRDFEKFAAISQPRRVELQRGPDGKHSLLCYLDLPADRRGRGPGGETLELATETRLRRWHYHEFRCAETAVCAQGPGEVAVAAGGLDPAKRYTLGFSWWRGFRHGDHGPHRQSVSVAYGAGKRIALLEDRLLPQFDRRRKEDVEQVEIPLPAAAVRAGRCRIVFTKTAQKAGNKVDPNVYVGEVWLRDGGARPLLPESPVSIAASARPRRAFTGALYAADPVGRRVDPGTTYRCPDRFYIDATTADPFIALERYGRRVRRAQGVDLSMYDFPTVCLWYAENSRYGGSGAENTTRGAVAEMRRIADSGFLRYSRAAVRLVPDSYLPNNQQGWWDDAHWQRPVKTHNGSKNGRYVEPYETSAKWGRAVTALGGIPLTYFQAGFRSEDYAAAFPGHMLFNKTRAWKGAPADPGGPLFTDWHKTWARNGKLWSYDYTDPGFRRHLRAVYRNLETGGVRGLMFDYPASAWARGGGMEDAHATTAAAYRAIFRIAADGLGPGAYIHERNMERGTDVSIGPVASMRTENDTDRFDGATATRCGLRWYKNRVLYNQDTDSKNIARLQDNRDRVRAVLTMAYVTTGRLLLANSFAQFSAETLRDLSRTFPYHTAPRSARPVDAFVSDVPAVYDFAVDPRWHQVTFFNPDVEQAAVAGIDLAGRPVDGALGLDAQQSYHVYDFWNDRYAGRVAGDARLEQTLRPGEARMLSVRAVRDRPQVLSTDRHLMQGYLDIVRTAWSADTRTLAGESRVVGGDPCVITLAANGYRSRRAATDDPDTTLTMRRADDGLVTVTLKRPENGTVAWSVTFAGP